MAVMRHSAVASLIALGVSVVAILYVDGVNDRDLFEAQSAAVTTHCEIAADGTVTVRSAFLRLAQTVPGYPPVAVDFVDWVKRCLVVQDCTQPTVAPPPLDDDCAVAPPVVATTIPGD